MKILVYGAGVLGSLYAARLQDAGHHVTVLARGQRLADIREHGILLENYATGETTTTRVTVVERLEAQDAYDWVLVILRKNQVCGVLPSLAENHHTSNVLFMTNNAAGPQELIDELGRERVLLGFPGGGGLRDGQLIRYALAPARAQPTTLGELDGRVTPRLLEIASALREAGFPVAFTPTMDAWLKTHVALVLPIACALYMAGGDIYRLARTQDALVLMVRGIREGLHVLEVLQVPLIPPGYKILKWLPEPLLVAALRRRLPSPRAELALAGHANAARDEMHQLANEFRALAHATGAAIPALDWLYATIDPQAQAAPDGQAGLALNWREVFIWVLAILAGLLFLRRFLRWRR